MKKEHEIEKMVWKKIELEKIIEQRKRINDSVKKMFNPHLIIFHYLKKF